MTPRKAAGEKRKFRERQARKAIQKKLKNLGIRILEQEILRKVRELIAEELIRMAELRKEMLEETAERLYMREDPNKLEAEFEGMRIDKHW